MLKAFCLGVASAFILALTSAVLARPVQYDLVLPHITDPESFLTDEGPVRSERSANISHILGVSRKIYIIMNRIGLFLQIASDGTVSGTDQDNDYTIFQRAALNNSKIKIQGIATCNFLCMDRCGLLYGSREFTDECVFNEVMEDHYFNTYSSSKYSNGKRTLYLALNKKGVPRKVQTKPNASLDKLETYTNVLTKAVPSERVEALEMKIYNARLLFGKFLLNSKDDHHSLRHHRYHQLCGNTPMVKSDEKNKFRCRKREKRKKKRKCREDEDDGDDCLLQKKKHHPGKWMLKCEDGEEDDECQKRLHMIRKKRKSRNGEGEVPEKDKKRKKRLKKKMNEKGKTVKSKCENGENGNCGRKQEEGRGQKEPEGEEYDADGFTDDPEPEDDTVADVAYDWTTSAAVQD